MSNPVVWVAGSGDPARASPYRAMEGRDELLKLIAQAEEERWDSLYLRSKRFLELPPEIGRLTNLTSLDLADNRLTALPPEIGRLTNLTSLDLAGNRLIALPPEIGCLTNLTSLNLRSNQLSTLPAEIGCLTNLPKIRLSHNRLTALPPEIGCLTNLAWLYLNGNQLTTLPSEIVRLTNLAWLYLRRNQLTVLPPEITYLTNLRELYLSDNELTVLPPGIGRLINLTTLDLDGNKLTMLPPEIGCLAYLTSLNLSDSQLTTLPLEMAQLTNLVTLVISKNQMRELPSVVSQMPQLTRLICDQNMLTDLPPEIAQLSHLRTLRVQGNRLTKLLSGINSLAKLRRLDLQSNQLAELPAKLGNLRDDMDLRLNGNPWSEPFDKLVQGPQEALFAYLRSLQRGIPQYEAKVLLIGEGAVGKSCLLSALRNEEFVMDRPTTHGIDIKQVTAEHPDRSVKKPLTLNFWDFGGQEVYRITHQFFFSRHALYLLVWKPREGREENALEGWLERIRLRVGTDARVLIVATHCNERQPELDYPALEAKYGDILAGHCQVDNSDGTGIPELRVRIAQTVAGMEYVGTPFNRQWLAARDEILELDETHVTRAEFAAVCANHDLDETDARALTSILHTLGYIIFYDADGLRDFVVLRPEWLTKAIGYVLEDKVTRAKRGVLDHHRLSEIWCEHGDEARETYHPRYFPYFMRLMEQYDVSARLEGQDASLVPQMVPYERPALPWEARDPTEQGQLTLVCEMDQNPPGLIAWTTVRNHRWSTDTHWRSGVFLQHEDGHQALVDFTSRLKRELSITVRGEYPAHFMSLIRDGLEQLVADRWPYLDYALYVPCPTAADGKLCPGRFPLQTLHRARAKRIRELRCQTCLDEIGVGQLLEGYVVPTEPLSQQLAETLVLLKEAKVERQRLLAQSAEMTRRVLRALLDQARDGPRLFTLSPIDPTKPLDPRNLWREELKLVLWCEHPGHEHPLEGPAGHYVIPTPKKWVARIAPYASLALQVLRIAAPVAGGAISLADEVLRDQYKPIFDAMGKFVSAASEVRPALQDTASHVDHLDHPYHTSAEGASLRAFHDLLAQVGWKPGAANLRRVTDKKSGDVLWVCAKHYREYDPGLPVLPEQT
ncbi:MAG: hypothetical protein GY832_24555 [Chloroflexi bacterium]|nr:hypothetical protein [Chloroflexota bacterium]